MRLRKNKWNNKLGRHELVQRKMMLAICAATSLVAKLAKTQSKSIAGWIVFHLKATLETPQIFDKIMPQNIFDKYIRRNY